MAESSITLVGALGADPVLRSGARGDWVKFSMATNPRWRDPAGTWVDGPASWFEVSADGDLGHHVAASLTKGQQVIVQGTISVRDVPGSDGSTSRRVTVKAAAIGPDLRWGTTRFTKAGRSRRPAAVAEQTPAPEGRGAPPPDVRRPEPAGAAWATEEDVDEVETPF